MNDDDDDCCNIPNATVNKNKFFFRPGLDKIEFLQNHENQDIYQKAFDIIERYFGTEEEDANLAPSMDDQAQQFQFASEEKLPPTGGFNF